MVQKSGSAPAASSADYMDYRIVNVADQSDVPGGVAAADISVREDDTVPTPEGECKDLEMADPGQSLEEDRDAIVGSSLIILFLLTIMIFSGLFIFIAICADAGGEWLVTFEALVLGIVFVALIGVLVLLKQAKAWLSKQE